MPARSASVKLLFCIYPWFAVIPSNRRPADHPLLLALVQVAARRKAVIDLHMDAVIDDSMNLPPSLKTPPNPKTLSGCLRMDVTLALFGRMEDRILPGT